MTAIRYCFAALLFPCLTLSISAAELTGKVVGVTDGDTITILVSNTTHKIRLAEIDTPERHQAFGTKAKRALSDKIFGKVVRVEYDTTDRYGRIIGKVYLGNRWINKEMVSNGWAWHYKYYSKDKILAKTEVEARDSKLGLWADKTPVPPWEFRKQKKAKS